MVTGCLGEVPGTIYNSIKKKHKKDLVTGCPGEVPGTVKTFQTTQSTSTANQNKSKLLHGVCGNDSFYFDCRVFKFDNFDP